MTTIGDEKGDGGDGNGDVGDGKGGPDILGMLNPAKWDVNKIVGDIGYGVGGLISG